MKANDLRLGNLIYAYSLNDKKKNDLRVAKVKGLGDGWIDYEYEGEFNHCSSKPIPLTEEWLERFGFEKREGSVGDIFYIGINPVTKDWMFDIVWLKNMMDYSYEDFPFYRNGHFRIKYVHQLQNLYFALTQEELNADL